MKTKSLKLFALALASASLLLFSSCSKEDASAPMSDEPIPELKAGNSGPSANGHGTIMWLYEGEFIKRQFTFHAKEKKDGTIVGNGVLTYIGGEFYAKFDIDCMLIDGNIAILSGVYTDHIIPENIGYDIRFKVMDNGEGNNADPDMITAIQLAPDLPDCYTYFDLEWFEVIGGNIQVKPSAALKAGNSGPSANGHGIIYFPYEGDFVKRQFSFHAKIKPDGTVQGSAVVSYIGGELMSKLDIDCMTVDGNTATCSGTITQHSPDPNLIGYEFWFWVEDNGEGANADPDRITPYYYSQSLTDCNGTVQGAVIYDLEGGNIQVKP